MPHGTHISRYLDETCLYLLHTDVYTFVQLVQPKLCVLYRRDNFNASEYPDSDVALTR